MPVFGFLSPGIIVYRVTTNKAEINTDTDKFLPSAFVPKEKDQAGGLSVIVSDDCPTLEQAAEWASRKGKVRGVASLSVTAIHELGRRLTVLQDEEHHAGILGIPYVAEEAQDSKLFQKMNDCAYDLAKISHICCREM